MVVMVLEQDPWPEPHAGPVDWAVDRNILVSLHVDD